MKRFALVTGFLLAATATSGPSEMPFDLIKIVEVFPGATASPNAKFVELQAYFAGQNFVGGHKMFFFDSDGVKLDSATFSGNVANSANQMTILIATASAQAFFGLSADLTMPAAIDFAGGKVCFDVLNIDCFAWGNYSGPAAGVGTPFMAATGLTLAKSAMRRLDIAGGPSTLEAADDTGDSDNDFNPGNPTPRNNAGITGSPPPSTCGNGVIEGLEQCDDGNTTPGDGCDESCQSENVCLVTQTGDVNESGTLTSADIIFLVNFVFKGQAPPEPCEAAGDVNCSGSVTSADIIFMVNHVFKGQAPPCDVCTIIPGTWTCP